MRGHAVVCSAFLVIGSCGGGSGGPDAVQCGVGELVCTDGCADPMTDHDHCGSCDHACDADQECRAGECAVPCRVGLGAVVEDGWGVQWDGGERTAGTIAEATAACEAFAGRLPTATEVWRARSGPDGIGTAADTNALWTSTPNNATDQVTVQLNDGTIGSVATTTPTPYRCVCSPDAPAYFSGSHCNGPAGSPCFTNGKMLLDNTDRPALRKSAAIAECAADHAHLASVPELIESLQKGVLGSGNYLHTADQSRYDLSTTLKWTVAAWAASGNVSYADATTPQPFRCAGWGFATGTHPNTIAGEFVSARGDGYKGESADSPAATWIDSQLACFARGGHLAGATELGELILAGLPSGSGSNLWTSDEVGYNGTQFLATIMHWSAIDPRYPFDYPTVVTWAYKTDPGYPFRCVYYPLDPNYIAPTTCNGGCYAVTLPGDRPAIMWFDSLDRGATPPTDLMETAIDACRREGGHLTTERDLAEAIRAGLPNGTNAWLMTSDLAMTNYHVVRWTGVDAAFDDQYSTYMSWSGPTTPYNYRCMWTNELR